MILRRNDGREFYEILDGNFEYYAIAQACQIDPRKCEKIEAFIVEPAQEKAVCRQIALLRGAYFYQEGRNSAVLEQANSDITHLATNSLDAGLEGYATAQAIHELRTQLQKLKKQVETRDNLLDFFNQSEADRLLNRMRNVGLTGRNAEKVVELIKHERQQKLFSSLKEIVTRVKGLTYEKIVDLLEI